MSFKFKSIIASLVLLTGAMTAMADSQLAFPDAAGWGRFAQGARNSSTPTVYHVTNLNDSGTGSLRDAVSASNRIVVFDVSGVIKISSRIVFSSNLYVAGQTAPGEGITVYGDGVSFSGASNIICRYLRVRMGHGGTSGKDCAGVANGSNMIFDHCSFSWGLDETFSINANDLSYEANITLQNCIIGQGLMTHSAGGLMQAKYITLYRNLYIDNSTRNNKVKGINQYANNIVYNWKNGCYIMGGDSDGDSYCNITSNLFINGPAKGGNALGGGNANFHFYGNDNWQDSNIDGIFNPSCIDDTQTGGGDKVSTPYDYPELELYPGNELLEKNIPTVGASLPYRDQSDCYMIDELMSYGSQGALITYETALPIGAPDTWTWWNGDTRTDSDKDGMPDAWESANGTDPAKADATVKAANGYLNIENYINSITADDRQFFLRTPVTMQQKSATTSTVTLGWRDYTYAEDGFAIEMKDGDTWKEIGRTAANATSYTVTGLKDGTSYIFRARAYAQHDGAEEYSDYTSEVTGTSRPVETGIIDIDTYEPDVTNSTDVADGKKLLLTTDGTLDYNLPAAISPASVVVTGKGVVTVTGDSIKGEGSMNKGGDGTLVLNNSNSYTGATVNHQGTIEFNTIANGGKPSAIGASKNFAQNWIFDGGTYKYTGGSAATDRSAQIKRESTLNIANSGTALTMNGVFEGDGDFVLDGNGTLNVADSTFFGYKGSTILKGGTLNLTDIEKVCKTFSSVINKLVMEGGHIKVTSKNEDYQTYSCPIEVVEGTTSQFTVGNACYVNNTLTGTGTLQFNIPYLRAYMNLKMADFAGTLIGNGTNSSRSLFFDSGEWDAPNVRFMLTGTTYLGSWTTNSNNTIGGLSGDKGTYLIGSSKKTSNFQCSWTVGGANTDETFNGIINNMDCSFTDQTNNGAKTSIKKVGTGYWRLTGNNSYAGTTTVSAGTLIVDGKHTGTGNIMVMNGATLKGQGTIAAPVLLYNGSTLAAGDTIQYGKTLTVTGKVSLYKGAALQVPVTNTDTKAYTQNSFAFNTLSIADGAKLVVDMENAPKVQKNKYFTVFATVPTSVTGSFTTIEPATPGFDAVTGDTLAWDTSTLFTDGKLYIIKKGGKREEEKEDTTVVDPEGETLYAMVNFGNSTLGSYDNSGVNNMLTGGDNDESRGFKLVCTGNLAKALATGGTSPSKVTVTFKGETLLRTPVKMSNGAQETLFLPEDEKLGKARASKITFVSIISGYTTETAKTAQEGYPRTSYWKEVAGTIFSLAQATADGKIINAYNDQRTTPSVISFDLNNVEQITFANAGEQQATIFIIEYHYGGAAGKGVAQVGDVNKDGEVNVLDVNTLITAVISGSKESKYDLSGDGTVNYKDVNIVIEKICGK